uniref:Uncharacterized protein n=1 Tax=Octopus bimaculoides TaxID=37653 RepID=A0A0L8IGL5_OCTBM
MSKLLLSTKQTSLLLLPLFRSRPTFSQVTVLQALIPVLYKRTCMAHSTISAPHHRHGTTRHHS